MTISKMLARVLWPLAASLSLGCNSSTPASGAVDGSRDAGGSDLAPSFQDAGSAPDVDPTSAGGFCRGYFGLLVDALVECDATDRAFTEMLLLAPAFCDRFQSSVAGGRTRFDPANAAACLTALRTSRVCSPSSSLAIPECAGVVTPLVPIGGTCRSIYLINLASECADDGFCKEGPDYACDGTCTARAAIGTPCDPASFDVGCASRTACNALVKMCVALPAAVAVDQPCGQPGQGQCQGGLFCDHTSSDGGTSGVCHARKTSGPCSTEEECAPPGHCAGPPTARSCSAVKPVGATCTPGWKECDPLSHCDQGGHCSNSRAALDQPCGSLNGESVGCADASYCDAALLTAGICRAQKRPGDTCTVAKLGECAGSNGHCDASTKVCVACDP